MRLYPRGLDMRACHPAPECRRPSPLVLRFPRPTFRLSRKAGQGLAGVQRNRKLRHMFMICSFLQEESNLFI